MKASTVTLLERSRSLSGILKVTEKEQEKMRQGIEKEQETKSTPNSVTVMFHGSTSFFGVYDLFLARDPAAPSLSETLTGDLIPAAAPSLPANLKSASPPQRLRVRLRRRSSQNIEKFSAEGLIAHSALAVLAANLNKRSQTAAATPKTTMQSRQFSGFINEEEQS